MNESVGKEAVPVEVEQVTATIDDVRGACTSISWRELRSFACAWALVAVMLRVLPLSWIINRIRRRKLRLLSTSTPFDVLVAHRLMAAYWILRPNFFDAKDACLRDSLTFVEFLARYNIHPTLVFGVKVRPFAAHAWVQQGAMVLNDFVPNVSRFVPIFAV